jgi:hypothetical protein
LKKGWVSNVGSSQTSNDQPIIKNCQAGFWSASKKVSILENHIFAADPRGQRRTIFLAGRLARLKPVIAGASKKAR